MAKVYNFKAEEAKNRCVEWIKKYFKVNGPKCNAIVGISGGKDSSVVAALCVEALGKERVYGVLMPNGTQPDFDAAKMLIDHLHIKYSVVNIHEAYKAFLHRIPFRLSARSRINLAPRIRMTTLYAVAQTKNGRVANTCNASEDYVGYSTLYGDSVGDFYPIADFTVQEVKEIGRVLGLPEELINKVPADGVCGKTDEDNLGFTYEELDRYIREKISPEPEKYKKIVALHEQNEFKTRPSLLMPRFRVGDDLLYKIVEGEHE